MLGWRRPARCTRQPALERCQRPAARPRSAARPPSSLRRRTASPRTGWRRRSTATAGICAGPAGLGQRPRPGPCSAAARRPSGRAGGRSRRGAWWQSSPGEQRYPRPDAGSQGNRRGTPIHSFLRRRHLRQAARRQAGRSRPCARRGRGCGWRSARRCRCRARPRAAARTRSSAVCGIEVAGGLVGQDQAGLRWRGRGRSPPAAARRRKAAAGRWSSRCAEAQPLEQRRRRAPPPRAAATAGDQQRHRHVLERGEIGQEVVELVDEADALAPEPRPLGVAQAVAGAAVDRDLAGARPFEQAGDVQERRLAGAGRTDQRRRGARRPGARPWRPLTEMESSDTPADRSSVRARSASSRLSNTADAIRSLIEYLLLVLDRARFLPALYQPLVRGDVPACGEWRQPRGRP